MPVLSVGARQVGWTAQGEGRAVLLLHCSGGGRQQWRPLMEALASGRRAIAPDLHGYGDTSPWTGPAPQTLGDQAASALAAAAAAGGDDPVDFVGHSFGALVALEAALRLGPRAGRLVLFEPNPFALLAPGGDRRGAAVAARLGRLVRDGLRGGDRMAAAAAFVDFFSGPGGWAALPPARREAVAAGLDPNAAEWDAVMDPALTADRWAAVSGPVHLVWAADSPAPLRSLMRILREANPGWSSHEFERGGHMAPISRSRRFNDLVLTCLDS